MAAFAASSWLGAPLTNCCSLEHALCKRRARWHCSNVLIINAKGGGHGSIGLFLARELLQAGHTVDMCQVGQYSDNGPISQYPTLQEQYPDRFAVRYGDPSLNGQYDAVYDNNAKSISDASAAVQAGKVGAEVFYVSSAGAYKYDSSNAPHIPGDDASGPTIDVEEHLRAEGTSAVCFRPIYIYGQYSSKREYLDYFFDRIARGRTLYLPGTGSEFTSLTDVRDVASMLAAALGKGLKNQVINSVATRAITFDGLASLCAEACGKEAIIEHYDPEMVEKAIPDFKIKKAFPFRVRHFFADPGEAQILLDWMPQYSGNVDALKNSIKEAYEEYVTLGLDKSEMSFELDDALAKALA